MLSVKGEKVSVNANNVQSVNVLLRSQLSKALDFVICSTI